jgi:2'-5' RNA ligase
MQRTENDPQVRVFFALWPADAERAALSAWQPPLRALCGGDAMRVATLHSTLAFLGEIEQHRLEALLLAAREVEGRRFEIEFDVARYWGHNHIVYAAPQRVPAALTELVEELELRLRKHRFRFEAREYKPHVTLLRHSKWSDTPLPEMAAVRWAVGDFALVQSLRDERGPNYEVLARFGLRT